MMTRRRGSESDASRPLVGARRADTSARRGRSATLAALATLTACAATLFTGVAAAQEQAATAEALFREARDLATKGNYVAACPKFAASQRLDPGYGTLYNLAECLAHQGRTASAWAAFHEAAAVAKSAGQADREAKALRGAQAVEGKLERMVIKVKAPVGGLVIKRSGVTIDEAAWGSPLPIDPGKHVVEATAPGKKPFSVEVSSAGPAAPVVVEIPALEDAPRAGASAPQPGAPAPEAPRDTGGPRRVAGIVTGAVGLVGVAIGAAMGASAKSSWNQAQSQDCKGTVCNQAGVNLVHSAKTAATVSTVGFVGGGLLTAAGVALIVTALPPKATASGRLVIAPVLDPARPGADLTLRF
jgi:hypothetical protein